MTKNELKQIIKECIREEVVPIIKKLVESKRSTATPQTAIVEKRVARTPESIFRQTVTPSKKQRPRVQYSDPLLNEIFNSVTPLGSDMSELQQQYTSQYVDMGVNDNSQDSSADYESFDDYETIMDNPKPTRRQMHEAVEIPVSVDTEGNHMNGSLDISKFNFSATLKAMENGSKSLKQQ